ncbi:MAG: M1 family metallopeptidase [Clostridiales bacterium]|nr:M1 family metallopeptidase [Clostridiales bacterium]
MRKQVLTFVLASIVLSAACQNTVYRPKETETTVETVVASDIETEDSEDEKENDNDESKTDPASDSKPALLRNETNRKKNQYDVSIKLDDEKHTLDVEQKLHYVNNNGKTINEIYFNLIPEAFKSKGGGLDMKSVSSDGKDLSMKQVKETVYSLPLEKELAPGESCDIHMNYTVNIPENADRFGYFGNNYNLGNVLATPALFENGQWLVQPYIDLGDAFYTEISDYRVKIDVPNGYSIAATGTLKDDPYVADDVRDFAFTASSEMMMLCEEYGDTALIVHYPKNCPNTGKHVMEVAKRSMDLFNQILGGYPYETLHLVCTSMPGSIGGMEYPGLVMLTVNSDIEDVIDLYYDRITVDQYNAKMNSTSMQGPSDSIPETDGTIETLSDSEIKNMLIYDVDSLTKSTAHEIAHQWFYGIVGNDEVRYPWIDEGMCRFMEGLYCEYYNEALSSFSLFERFKSEDESIYQEFKGEVEESYPIDLNDTLYDYKKKTEDYGMIYYKGAAMIYHMYSHMGSESFFEAISDYIKTFAYTEVTPDEFVDFWTKKGDFKEMFEVYMKDF